MGRADRREILQCFGDLGREIVAPVRSSEVNGSPSFWAVNHAPAFGLKFLGGRQETSFQDGHPVIVIGDPFQDRSDGSVSAVKIAGIAAPAGQLLHHRYRPIARERQAHTFLELWVFCCNQATMGEPGLSDHLWLAKAQAV